MDSAADPVFTEHAVFTSVRSPWGRGYRIIAASTGITPDEKREIVQRAPSHQSICAASPDGRGVASFAMQSGRRCVFLVQNAGIEHSARGDFRVHTHVLVMEPANYRRLRSDPLAVASAARAALGDEWLSDRPPSDLERLALAAGTVNAERALLPDAGDVNGLLTILSRLLAGRRVLVHGPAEPERVLAWLWSGVPAGVRDGLALASGLRFAPGRSFPLVLTEMARGEAQRIGVDYDYEVLAWPVVGALDASEFGPWLDFAGRRWVAGQRAELEELSTELTEESSALALQRVAALSDDLARVVDADLALLDELAARHTGDASSGGAIARLYAELLRSAAVRREQLQPQKPVTSANGSKPDVDERPRRQSESESVP